MATYSLVVVAISGVRTLAVPCLPPLGFMLASGAIDCRLPPFWHSLGWSPLFYEHVGLEHGVLVFSWEWSFVLLVFSLVCLCRVMWASSEYLHGSQLQSFSAISVVNFLHFASGAPVALCFSLRFWSYTLTLPMRGFSSVQKLFLAHNSLPGVQVPISNYFVSLLSLFLPYLTPRLLEKEMATHPSVLAWRIPGTGEPGGLSSMGSHRVEHDWSDLAAFRGWFAFL